MNARTTKLLIASFVSLAIFAVMALTIRDTAPWQGDGAGIPDELEPLVDGIFDTHVIAFEVLGILLTAAMIGALVVARPLGQAPDESHYALPTLAQLTASQNQADPAMHQMNTQQPAEKKEAEK